MKLQRGEAALYVARHEKKIESKGSTDLCAIYQRFALVEFQDLSWAQRAGDSQV